MNDEVTGRPPPPNREMSIRSVAVEMAIKSGSGTSYDDEGRQIVDAQRIISAAKQIENYIKGEINNG